MRLIPLADVIGTQRLPTITASSFTFPKTHSYSVSYARRIFWNQVVEAAYVGTTGRDLVGLVNINVVPYGAISTGVLGTADLSVPVNRVIRIRVSSTLSDRTRCTAPSRRLTTSPSRNTTRCR